MIMVGLWYDLYLLLDMVGFILMVRCDGVKVGLAPMVGYAEVMFGHRRTMMDMVGIWVCFIIMVGSIITFVYGVMMMRFVIAIGYGRIYKYVGMWWDIV